MKPMRDEDIRKGAVEQEAPRQYGNENFAGQNPHRNASPLAEGQDTDFPEPGQNPEHSGQKISNGQDRPLETARGERESNATAKRKGDAERDQSRDRAPAGQSPERDTVDQDPGERQKRNQGNTKDDPLAA